jgi:hypothetical protein
MAMKYINNFKSPSKIYSNWNFWFENKPSGNPAGNNEKRSFQVVEFDDADKTEMGKILYGLNTINIFLLSAEKTRS